MPSVVVGGTTYQLAGLRLADVRALSREGWLGKLAKLAELEAWEQIEAAAHIVTTSVRRAGSAITADELLELAAAQELPAIIAAVSEVMKLSGFVAAAGETSPNAESPATSTSVG